MNIWLCGIPGSKWSGIDIRLRHSCNGDKSDETPERVFHHALNNPQHNFNGHRGSYWGPGMGCGETWDDMSRLSVKEIQDEIDTVFTGTGHRTIKAHTLARHNNLEYVWNNFKGDYMVLIYRDARKSMQWWSKIMDFGNIGGIYPNYTKMYGGFDTFEDHLRDENNAILEFAFNHKFTFEIYDPIYAFKDIPGWDYELAKVQQKNHEDVFITVQKII